MVVARKVQIRIYTRSIILQNNVAIQRNHDKKRQDAMKFGSKHHLFAKFELISKSTCTCTTLLLYSIVKLNHRGLKHYYGRCLENLLIQCHTVPSLKFCYDVIAGPMNWPQNLVTTMSLGYSHDLFHKICS